MDPFDIYQDAKKRAITKVVENTLVSYYRQRLDKGDKPKYFTDKFANIYKLVAARKDGRDPDLKGVLITINPRFDKPLGVEIYLQFLELIYQKITKYTSFIPSYHTASIEWHDENGELIHPHLHIGFGNGHAVNKYQFLKRTFDGVKQVYKLKQFTHLSPPEKNNIQVEMGRYSATTALKYASKNKSGLDKVLSSLEPISEVPLQPEGRGTDESA